MKTALKWIGTVAAIILALGIVAYIALTIYDPGLGWVKPGIAQRRIPAGVETSVVFENVTVIPMDSERILEGQTVVIEDQRISAIGTGTEVEIPTKQLSVNTLQWQSSPATVGIDGQDCFGCCHFGYLPD